MTEPVHGLDEPDGFPAFLSGNETRAVLPRFFKEQAAEFLKLSCEEVSYWIDGFEEGLVFGAELLEELFLSRYGPEIVQGRIDDGTHTRDKH